MSFLMGDLTQFSHIFIHLIWWLVTCMLTILYQTLDTFVKCWSHLNVCVLPQYHHKRLSKKLKIIISCFLKLKKTWCKSYALYDPPILWTTTITKRTEYTHTLKCQLQNPSFYYSNTRHTDSSHINIVAPSSTQLYSIWLSCHVAS